MKTGAVMHTGSLFAGIDMLLERIAAPANSEEDGNWQDLWQVLRIGCIPA